MNFDRDHSEVVKIQDNLNRDRRNFMLTAHARRKTYEDF